MHDGTEPACGAYRRFAEERRRPLMIAVPAVVLAGQAPAPRPVRPAWAAGGDRVVLLERHLSCLDPGGRVRAAIVDSRHPNVLLRTVTEDSGRCFASALRGRRGPARGPRHRAVHTAEGVLRLTSSRGSSTHREAGSGASSAATRTPTAGRPRRLAANRESRLANRPAAAAARHPRRARRVGRSAAPAAHPAGDMTPLRPVQPPSPPPGLPCGRTVEIEGRGVERWAPQVAENSGFTDVDHTVELMGSVRRLHAAMSMAARNRSCCVSVGACL